MWACKNCQETVEDNFIFCWNCKHDQKGSLDTYRQISNDNNSLIEASLVSNIGENEFDDKTYKEQVIGLRYDSIIFAGKALKNVVKLILLMILLSAVYLILYYCQFEAQIINGGFWILITLSLLIHLLILFNIYEAGEALIHSVKKSKNSNE